ncbi:ATP-dependent nuclease subunit B [Thermaerobacter marianensis DSM 12885]|uniref:ATP-dependent nuclease subunit B n=1 Tax=Thermaerobacter marianensis (strain ATCC 700841 / DSM 12885 / JCM 10246 / 7p75a) TaxID=644966 RepID=E6SIJ3_THEM7|nr:PD-(D/E)XK nuclease family protein [Thermaerobacter marianensis]ADU50899.1 ATP-dependent nuclease subunit B [Thermaerobacter marianensis DSM 12885]
MSLRLVLGRAGSGKTHHCLSAVAREELRTLEGPPLILLVPEQATFQMEQALLAELGRLAGRRGFARTRVASFQRLAWWIQQEVGGGTAPPVSELGKRLILRALVTREAGRLKLFRQVADRPGFVDRLAVTLAELAAYGVGPEDLRSRYEQMDRAQREGLLGVKLHDLALLLQAYQEYLAEHGLEDPAYAFDRVARQIRDSRWLRDARVWVDGFTGFTTAELRVLASLMRVAQRVEVSLCLDPDEAPWAVQGVPGPGTAPGGPSGTPGGVRPGRDPAMPVHRPAGKGPGAGEGRDESALFHPTWVTARQLLDLARQEGVGVEPALTLTGRGRSLPRFRNPALAHLERELFQFPGRRFPGLADGVTLVAAPDRRAEVAAAAREMLRLAREEGYRFRDMVVIVRDLETYHDLLVSACAEHGIPLFVDRRRPVGHHPLIELVRAALEVVAGDWPYEAVFRYLKTDLVPVPRGAVDRLENYVLAFGIRGSLWYGKGRWTWRRHDSLEADEAPRPEQEAELEAVNGIRDEATAHLRRFFDRVKSSRRQPVPARDLARALYALLLDLDIPAQLQRWSEEAERDGDLEAAQEHLQVWNGVSELLEQVEASLPEIHLTAGEFLRVLEAGMEGLRVGLIPPGLDQVVAGSVERSRHPSARAAFVLGATDDAFPRRIEEDAIFTDREREELAAAGLDLGPPGRVRALHEQYFAYVALTRARDRLWVSYPLGDEEGRAVAPAWLTRRMRVLLPGLEVSPADVPGPEGVATPAQAVDQLARLLACRRHRAADPAGPAAAGAGRGTAEPWAVLYQWAVTDPDVQPRLRKALAAVAYGNHIPPLGRDLARQLYARMAGEAWELRTSVSRLERFAACPFQHFAAFGLGLREREVGRLDAPRLGRVYHAALSLLSRKVWEAGIDWADLSEARLEAMVAECLQEIAPRLRGELAADSAYYEHLLRDAGRILTRTALRLAEHARRGTFRPLAVEADFGPEAGARLPFEPWELSTGERLALRGRIDRIDGARTEAGRWLIRVIDYKSSRRQLPLDRVYHGLSLQLPLYLLVATRAAARLGTLDAAQAGEPAQPETGTGPASAPTPDAAPEPAALLFFPVHDPYVDVERPLTPEEAAVRRAIKELRAEGWILDEPEAVRAHDQREQPETLIPVGFTKGGKLQWWSKVLSAAQFEALFRHVEERVRGMAEAMLQGRAEVAPYRFRKESPCADCAFKALCQFDPYIPGNGYRVLQAMKPAEFWDRLRQEGKLRALPRETGGTAGGTAPVGPPAAPVGPFPAGYGSRVTGAYPGPAGEPAGEGGAPRDGA